MFASVIIMTVVYILLGNLIFLGNSSSVFDKNLEECFRKQRAYEAQAKATLAQVQHWDTATTIPVLHTYIRSDANVNTKKKFIQSEQEHIKIEDSRNGRSDRVAETLRSHHVKGDLVDEINNMAVASIPHEYIVQHVSTHYPEKTLSEWNDIVISSLSARGRQRSQLLRYKRASQNTAGAHKVKYEALKKTHEFKTKQSKKRTA